MRRLKLYIATSLDGYIAGPNGEIDWLEAGGNLDYGYGEFYSSIDTTLMGTATYRLTLIVDDFPYPDKSNYVFTRGTPPPDTAYVRFISVGPRDGPRDCIADCFRSGRPRVKTACRYRILAHSPDW